MTLHNSMNIGMLCTHENSQRHFYFLCADCVVLSARNISQYAIELLLGVETVLR